MKRIRLLLNSNLPALRQVAFSADVSMKCLAIHDWKRGLGIGSIHSALREHFGGHLLETKRCLVVVSGWPRAKKVSSDGLQALLKQPEDIKSIDGELTVCLNNKNTSVSFLINSAPKMLFVGVSDDVQTVARFDHLIQNLARKAELGYGYVFHGEDSTEAAFYAAGVTYVRAGQSIKQIVSDANDRWFNELALGGESKYSYTNSSRLRAVYELNVLNRHHIEFSINGEQLFSVVRENGWGSIKKISSNNWLWWLDEENRTDAEKYLQSSSLII